MLRDPWKYASACDYWQDEPWFGEDIPGVAPFLVDHCSKEDSYVWYQFAYDGFDLGIERCANESEGELPGWYDWQESCAGTEFFIEPDTSRSVVDTPYGKIDAKFASYAMLSGIAPYQPFLVWFGEPICGWFDSYYGEEYDFEVVWDIEKIIPLSDFEVRRRWEWWFEARNRTLEIVHEAKTRKEKTGKKEPLLIPLW